VKNRVHWWLLLLWLLLGGILRFTNLASKPPWSDEWATLVFSLGHSFRTIPLDRVISLDTLLSPLQLDSTTHAKDVITNLLTESTHPPIYFVLTHWWLQLVSGSSGLISIWWGRALSSILGMMAIPAIFGVSWILSRSLVAAQITAALMAVSPYGVYLAQEARHYTLAILWVLASLLCLVLVIRNLTRQKISSIALILLWIIVNNLGIGTHYFFSLTLVAETIVLLGFWMKSFRTNKSSVLAVYWQRIYIAIIGTMVGGSVWLSFWRRIPDNQLTNWVFDGNPLAAFYEPLTRLLVWLITMIFLLPIEGVTSSIAIISGVIILAAIIYSFPSWIRGFKEASNSQSQLTITIISRFLLGSIGLILAVTYVFGADLTLSARFQFFYYPALILLFGIILSHLDRPMKLWQNKIILLTILLSCLGSLTIINNWAFQKVERPDLVVPVIIEASNKQIPVIIATAHNTHGQTGEMMSLGWQFQTTKLQPSFLLAHSEINNPETAIISLKNNLDRLPRPFQLWLVNFSAIQDLNEPNCLADDRFKDKTTGYRYRMYLCK
jgi:uncharacterized membrane protein